MAFKMPEYQRQVEQAPVVRQQVQPVNASIAPGLDALGRGISQAGQGFGVYNARREAAEQRERDKANQLRVRAVLAEVSSGSRDFLETPLDNEGNGGILNKRGENAIKASVEDTKVFQQFVKGKVDGLTPEQRALIEPSITAELEKFSHVVDRHVAQETDQFNKSTSEALLANRTNASMAARLRGDRDTAEEEYGAGLGEIDNISRLSGEPIGGAAHQKRVADYTDSVRRGTIEAMLASDPAEAERLFAEWQPVLNQVEVTRTKLGQRVKGASDAFHAEAMADEAIMQHGYGAAEFIASSDADPEMKEAAAGVVRKKIAEADRFQDAADAETLGIISQTISKGQGLYTIQDLEMSPEFSKLGKEQAKATAYNMVEAQRRAKSKNPNDRKTQAGENKAAIELYERMALEDPLGAAAIDVDSDPIFSKADDTTHNILGQIRARVRKNNDSGASMRKADAMTSLRQNVAGWKKEKAAKVIAAFSQEYDDWLEANEGKPMPREQASKRIDYYTKPGQIDIGKAFGIFGDGLRAGTAYEAAARGRPFIPTETSAPAAAKPSAPSAPKPPPDGKVRMKDNDGKIWYLTPDQAAAAEKAGAGKRF